MGSPANGHRAWSFSHYPVCTAKYAAVDTRNEPLFGVVPLVSLSARRFRLGWLAQRFWRRVVHAGASNQNFCFGRMNDRGMGFVARGWVDGMGCVNNDETRCACVSVNVCVCGCVHVAIIVVRTNAVADANVHRRQAPDGERCVSRAPQGSCCQERSQPAGRLRIRGCHSCD